MNLYDTIAAIATPMGTGGVAIIRLSGAAAEEIAQKIISAKNRKPLSLIETHKLTLCAIHRAASPDDLIDEALVSVMRAPHSYTGETVVEINCHGGFFAASKILEELLVCGARLAEGGEFTRRAFINGKTDLTGAEATMDIIDSHSSRGLNNAAKILNGSLAEKIDNLREKVIAITSHISAATDYPEEVDPPEPEELTAQLTHIQDGINSLLGTFEVGRIMRDGITTVIVGRPNVGKSSLLNALSRSDRAIVTDIPGTTRDVVEEYIHIGGTSLRLLDTAGIRSGADVVEQIGIEKAMSYIKEADLCLFVLDSTEQITDEDMRIAENLKDKRTLVLLNKTDKTPVLAPAHIAGRLNIDGKYILETATPKNGSTFGIDALEAAIEEMFINGKINPGEVYLSNTRQRDSLLKAKAALDNAIAAANSQIPYDLLYVDLEDALSALGEVTGVTIREEIIDNVFARFCVGK